MQFTKMHGLQNDYIYIDVFQERVANPAALARAVSDRHAGIGSDGLILIGPSEAHVDADVRMRIFNADGGEAQMCGNGIRCVAKFAIERGLASRNPLRIQTGRGTLLVSWRADTHGKVQEITVDMGLPILKMVQIPAQIEGFSAQAQVVGVSLPASWWAFDRASNWKHACGCDGKLSLVSMGNPHAIFWCEDVSKVPLEIVGPSLEHHSTFPERVNIQFAQPVGKNSVKVRTWERGSGMTQACGTGACAVVVAGVLEAKLSAKCEVVLPGGALQVEWAGLGHSVIMTGPAVEVCRGELSNELLQKAI
ncbi:MAG: diaminopimelate epimerase [Phycisphaerales bacterium]|nr:diaminopimelate epimerase [Phycisphaerales bacterium]